jgi:hypothetical protein
VTIVGPCINCLRLWPFVKTYDQSDYRSDRYREQTNASLNVRSCVSVTPANGSARKRRAKRNSKILSSTRPRRKRHPTWRPVTAAVICYDVYDGATFYAPDCAAQTRSACYAFRAHATKRQRQASVSILNGSLRTVNRLPRIFEACP